MIGQSSGKGSSHDPRTNAPAHTTHQLLTPVKRLHLNVNAHDRPRLKTDRGDLTLWSSANPGTPAIAAMKEASVAIVRGVCQIDCCFFRDDRPPSDPLRTVLCAIGVGHRVFYRFPRGSL